MPSVVCYRYAALVRYFSDSLTALCDFSICGALEKHLLTYLLTYLRLCLVLEAP